MLWILLVSGFAGLEVLLAAGLALSAHLLREQESGLAAEAARLSEVIGARKSPPVIDDPTRELIALRAARRDLTPKLIAIAERCQAGTVLSGIELKGGSKRGGTLRLTGEIRPSREAMPVVTRLIDDLKGDRRIAADFPQVRLGGFQEATFQVTCSDTGRAQ
jgi:hypothetical protein